MKHFEPGGMGLLWKILWLAVAMYVLGALITGSGSFLYNLQNPNTTNTVVILMFSTVLGIIIAVSIAYAVYKSFIGKG